MVTCYGVTVPITDHEGKVHIITLAEGTTELKPSEFYIRLLKKEEEVERLLKALSRITRAFKERLGLLFKYMANYQCLWVNGFEHGHSGR
ncbi:MAG: hypothetical protein AOA65_0197 [Candidatus Bathyarchaeota archaeon BA1]|nr:MAG: hypothetical protein AOA65_0197 [Candidatus Bathyarchaeota archaeon BA1]